MNKVGFLQPTIQKGIHTAGCAEGLMCRLICTVFEPVSVQMGFPSNPVVSELSANHSGGGG